MSSSSRGIDPLQATFDHGGIVANAGQIVPATFDGPGAIHIDHVDILRTGATQRVLPFTLVAPSTIGGRPPTRGGRTFS